MQINFRKILPILVICLLFLSVFSITGCIVEEKKEKEETGNGNGDNGNNNNTTNGDNGNQTPIKFTELFHDPPEPHPGQNVRFDVTIESLHTLDSSKVNITICDESTGICYEGKVMTVEPQVKGHFYHNWKIPSEAEPGKRYSYQISASDTLGNDEKSEKIEFEII